MKVFAIFLCIVIGHVFGDLQRVEIGKSDSKAKEDAKEIVPPYVKEAINLDQYLQSKEDVQVPTQSSSSNEAKTDEKPSSLVLGSPLTSGAYKVKKKGKKKGKTLHLETRKALLLLKHSPPNPPAKKVSTKFRGAPAVRSAAIRYAGKDSSIKTGRSFRRNPLNAFRLGDTNNKKLLDIPKPQEHENRPVTVPETVVARKPAVSHSAMQYLLNKLPDVLKSKLLIADNAKKVVAENYVKSQSVPAKSLNGYNSAKKDERELLKRLLTNTPILMPTNKSIQKGIEWNRARLHDKFSEFFHMPFTAMEPYEALKRDELTSLEILLGDSDQSDDSVNVETSRYEETRKVTRTKRAAPKKKKAKAKKSKPKSKPKPKQKAAGKGKQQVNRPKTAIKEYQPVGPDGFNDPPVTCNVDVTLTEAQIKEFLQAHNDARRREKASDMLKLTWDPVAAKLAQQKANGCVRGHSMLKDCAGKDIGQSLFTSFYPDGKEYPILNITQTTFAWADENKDWNYQTKTCAPGKQCGHWETLAAAAVRTVGCAAAKCLTMRTPATQGHANYVVCNYFPYYRGIKTFALGAPCSQCAKVAATTAEKGWTCENQLCVPCHPKKKAGCKPASAADEDL